jgi:hypothetical protein
MMGFISGDGGRVRAQRDRPTIRLLDAGQHLLRSQVLSLCLSIQTGPPGLKHLSLFQNTHFYHILKMVYNNIAVLPFYSICLLVQILTKKEVFRVQVVAESGSRSKFFMPKNNFLIKIVFLKPYKGHSGSWRSLHPNRELFK